MLGSQQWGEVSAFEGREAQVSEDAIEGSQCDDAGSGDLDPKRLAPAAEIDHEPGLDALRAIALLAKAAREVEVGREGLAVSVGHLQVSSSIIRSIARAARNARGIPDLPGSGKAGKGRAKRAKHHRA